MERKAWHAAVHGIAKRWTHLSDLTELKDITHIIRLFCALESVSHGILES